MIVFLPYPNFHHSVAVLDKARLGKQRVECGWILGALRGGDQKPNARVLNHPACRMWQGYHGALSLYLTLAIWEWERRGFKNTMVAPYTRDLEPEPLFHWQGGLPPLKDMPMPPWLGREDLHASHRARLLAKDPEHYGQFGWTEPPGDSYVYPV